MNTLHRNIIFVIVILLTFLYFTSKKEDIIYLKLFRNNYPWGNGFKKYSIRPLKLERDNHTKHKVMIATNIVPKTMYLLDNKLNLSKLLKNKSYYPETYIYDKDNKLLPKYDDIWFIKSCNYSTFGGHGVNAVNKVSQIKNYLTKGKNYIIQKSIKNMYLYDNKKGDVRVYYLATFYKNKLEFYLYKEGLIKLAKENYNIKNMDTRVQLTNTSQLNESDKPNSVIFNKTFIHYEIFLKKIKYVLSDLSKEIKKDFSKNYKSSYPLEFQLAGPDFIFDSNYNPYLIELNSNFPAYMSKTNKDIKDMKKNIAKVMANHLFEPAIKGGNIDIEKYGFIKL